MLLHLRGEIVRHHDIIFGGRLDRCLYDFPQALAANGEPVGAVEPFLTGNDLRDDVLRQLASDEFDQLTAGHSVELDAPLV